MPVPVTIDKLSFQPDNVAEDIAIAHPKQTKARLERYKPTRKYTRLLPISSAKYI